MKLVTYQADGILYDVILPPTAPVIGFAEARIKDGDTVIALSASPVEARKVRVSSGSTPIAPGSWLLQVRAGADAGTARTVYEDTITVKDSI